jgi:hypothetical protein
MNVDHGTGVGTIHSKAAECGRLAALGEGEGIRLQPADALDDPTIAELPDTVIRHMSQDELARLICSAGLPLAPGFDAQRLLLQERAVVERMAYLARETCRHRILRQSARLRSGTPSRRQ